MNQLDSDLYIHVSDERELSKTKSKKLEKLTKAQHKDLALGVFIFRLRSREAWSL